jgi:hypothetical protein
VLANQRIEHSVFGGDLGLRFDLLAQPLAGLRDRDLDQVAGDLLDIAADIADLGELGRLDLQERRFGQPRQAACDLGLAAARRADHQDVFRQHLLAQFRRQLLAAPAVAQGDRDGPLRLVLPDDETIELGDDLARTERGHIAQLCRTGGAQRSPPPTSRMEKWRVALRSTRPTKFARPKGSRVKLNEVMRSTQPQSRRKPGPTHPIAILSKRGSRAFAGNAGFSHYGKHLSGFTPAAFPG